MGLFEEIAVHYLKFRLAGLAGVFVFACCLTVGLLWMGVPKGVVYGGAVGIVLGLPAAVGVWKHFSD